MTTQLNAAARLRTQVKADMNGKAAVAHVKLALKNASINGTVSLGGNNTIKVSGKLLGQEWSISLELSPNGKGIKINIPEKIFDFSKSLDNQATSVESVLSSIAGSRDSEATVKVLDNAFGKLEALNETLRKKAYTLSNFCDDLRLFTESLDMDIFENEEDKKAKKKEG